MCRVWVRLCVTDSGVSSGTQVQDTTGTEHQAQGDVAGVSNTKELRRRRFNLMRYHPFCHWCGRKLVYFKMEGGGKTPDDFATIDHINSRLIYPNGRPRIGKQVLACPPCNRGRAVEEKKSLGVEELTRRAQIGHIYRTSASMIESSSRELSSPAAQSGESRDPMALARSANSSRARSI